MTWSVTGATVILAKAFGVSFAALTVYFSFSFLAFSFSKLASLILVPAAVWAAVGFETLQVVVWWVKSPHLKQDGGVVGELSLDSP